MDIIFGNVPCAARRRVSRRALLGVATGAAGAMLSVAGTRAQVAKVAPDAAGYQDMPQNGQACPDCKHFSAPASCKLVDGTISPQGWCKLFAQ